MHFFTDVHRPSAIILPFCLHRNEISTTHIMLNFYLPAAGKIFSKCLLYQQFCETESVSQLVKRVWTHTLAQDRNVSRGAGIDLSFLVTSDKN